MDGGLALKASFWISPEGTAQNFKIAAQNWHNFLTPFWSENSSGRLVDPKASPAFCKKVNNKKLKNYSPI